MDAQGLLFVVLLPPAEGPLDFGAQLLLSPLITVRSFLVFPGRGMIDPENLRTGLSALWSLPQVSSISTLEHGALRGSAAVPG